MRSGRFAVAAMLAWGLCFQSNVLTQAAPDREEETGQYEPAANWPQPWSERGYLSGSNAGVFAQSPDRVFLAVRGELKAPDPAPRNFLGFWGSLDQRATVPQPELRNCIVVIDRNGKAIEKWTQWDHLFQPSQPPRPGDYFAGPHKIKINPYDPEQHVWVVNEVQHVIYEFTNDGKQLVRTIGESGVAANDEKHFGRPQDLAWLPDGSMVVADGLLNSRIVKFDRNGKFVAAWGTKGDGPGQLNGPHGIETDRDGRIFVADRSNRRVQTLDQNGRPLEQWAGFRQINDLYIGVDQQVWVVDGVNSRLLKFDRTGKLQYWWGTHGTYPGAFWEPHQVSVDPEGNVYVADSYNGRTQKFVPKAGADRAKLLSPPRVARSTASR